MADALLGCLGVGGVGYDMHAACGAVEVEPVAESGAVEPQGAG